MSGPAFEMKKDLCKKWLLDIVDTFLVRGRLAKRGRLDGSRWKHDTTTTSEEISKPGLS